MCLKSYLSLASPFFRWPCFLRLSAHHNHHDHRFCAFSRRRSSVNLPESRGLKILSTRSTRSVSSTSRPVRRVRRITCEAPETAVVVPPVTDATWQSVVLESDSPVLVEFWAPWCGPCRMIHPIIDEVAEQYTGKL